MALSEESRTLLQLLLGRGKSYADIAGLLGITEDEARGRAHQALTEINGSDPDVDANLTDYLLGQSDPIGRADVARAIAENEEVAETASSLSDQLRLLVPGAELPRAGSVGSISAARSGSTGSRPRKPKASTKASAPATPADTETSGSDSAPGSTNSRRNRLLAILVMAAILVAVIILVATGAFSSDDSSDDSATTGSGAFAGATMQPVGNQNGSGRVQLGRVDENFAASLRFSDLAPTGNAKSYVLWMDGSLGAFPLSDFQVGKSGTFANTVFLPPEALCSISAGVFTDLSVSQVNRAQAKGIVTQTQKALEGEQGRLPKLAGKEVYTGPIALPTELRNAIDQQCQAAPAANNE